MSQMKKTINKSRSGKYKQKRRSKRKIPYMGKISLFWCDSCCVPLLDNVKCDLCGISGRKVEITPPGDVRPAFIGDYQLLWDTLDSQYGDGLGKKIFHLSDIVLLNRIGGLDRNDEIIINGYIFGILTFNPLLSKHFIRPQLNGGRIILEHQIKLNIRKKVISINDDSIPFILKGKSILAPGVLEISSDIKKDDYCLIVNQHKLIAIGIAKSDSDSLKLLLNENYGVIAKNKVNLKNLDNFDKNILVINQNDVIDEISDFDSLEQKNRNALFKAYNANYSIIQKNIQKATNFIKKTIKDVNKQVAVAYSGGKDSLCVLLLVWKVLGPNFKIFFADTGLELPEVLENVQNMAKVLDMKDDLIIKKADEKFWELVETFGPPGRDFRFCCHTLKAQQIMDIINEIYGGEKALVFLGQRQYESFNRADSKLVYVNSFIPLQIAATPIKKWNALLLWLFILFEPVYKNPLLNPEEKANTELKNEEEKIKIPYNKLYFHGNERLGCYLCPAASLSSFKLLEKTHPILHEKWFSFLKSYAEKNGISDEWIKLGLWRFKELGPQWVNLLKLNNLSMDSIIPKKRKQDSLELNILKGFSPCVDSGYSIKGKFSQPLNLENLVNFIPSFSKDFDYNEELFILSINSKFKNIDYVLNVFSDGAFLLKTAVERFDYAKFIQFLYTCAVKTEKCNLCETCISICPQQAITKVNSLIQTDLGKCIQCGKCITHCPLDRDVKSKISKII
jgi:phosphoadenosine phosphosulfate reductase